MPALPFQKIRQIEQILDQVEMENLVLIFSQKDGDQYLLVYNGRYPPAIAGANWQTCSLEELTPANYTDFDGPVAGFAALDVIFSDIPTHGVNFYALERVFQQRGKQALLVRTAYHLAVWLFERLMHLSYPERQVHGDRGLAKVVQLALPRLLASRSARHLVGVIPADDLAVYLGDQPNSLRPIYLEDLDELSDLQVELGQWVLAFDEIRLFNRSLGPDNPRFIDLRPVLHLAGKPADLRQTCLDLARRCWQEVKSNGNPDFLRAAYAMATEAWVAQEDVEDLVALLPHEDFECFVERGDALRLYRTPRLSSMNRDDLPGPRYSLGDLVRGTIKGPDAIQVYQTPPVSFPILSQALVQLSPHQVFDLGPVLRRAGRESELATTFWLLSRDLLKLPSTDWLRINAQAEPITNLALRATLIYSLSDPWQWRQARHEQFLEQSYNHLVECLINQENLAAGSPLSDYYRALREWYGCYTSEDLPHSLNAMLQACRDVLEKSNGRPELQIQRGTAVHLAEISERLALHAVKLPSREDRQHALPRHFEVANYLKPVADSTTQISVLSPPFEHRLSAYEDLHARWETIQNSLGSQRPSFEMLNTLLAGYARLARVAYAPAHELAVLQWACQQDMQRIQHLRDALEAGPVIQFRVRNPQVILGKREWLYLDVENLGGANACRLQVELSPSRQFELLSPSVAATPEVLAPAQHYRLMWEIHPLETPINLNITYRFQDQRGRQQADQQTISVNVIQSKEARIKPQRGILYPAGPPVWGLDRFFGRREELRKILNRLLGGITQPILLRGPRRMGKTSILRQLEWLLSERGELQKIGFSAEEEIQLRAIHPVMTSLQEVSSVANLEAIWFQKVFTDVCQALGPEREEIRIAAKDFEQVPTWAFRQHMARLFERRPHVRPLIMIDEWDELRHPRLLDLAKNLRAIMEDRAMSERVNWVVSSTWTLSEASGQYGSPFYNQTFPVELKELEWEPATQLVLAPSEKMGVTWHGDAVVTALEQTGRRPYLIQLLCATIMDYLYGQPQSLVDSQIVTVAINQLIKEKLTSSQPFGFLWGNTSSKNGGEARLRWLGQLILYILDMHFPTSLTRLQIREVIEGMFRQRGLELPEPRFFNQEFGEQMTQLEFIFDVIALEGDRYTFSIPLTQRWFHQVVSQQTDPIKQAHTGLVQDWEEWKKGHSGDKE